MPNSIKYSTGTEENALGVGDMHIGTGDVAKGPTNTTGFYNGINPPSGGYTIYINKEEGGPSIVCPSSDAELITITNKISGETYQTIDDCFTYFAGEDDKMVMQHTTNSLITSGLSLNLDASQVISYPTTGTSWYDISGDSRNGTLTNGVTFNSEGYMDFDGDNDYVAITSYTFGNGNWTVSAWVNADLFSHNLLSNTSGGPVTNAFGFGSNGTANKMHYRNYDGEWQNHYGNTTVETGTWYMVTWVNYGGAAAADGTMKMYLNGVADSEVFNSYTTNGGPCDAIGRNWGSDEYNGRIANIQFYTESLTDAEVLQNYYQGSIVTDGLVFAVDASNLVSYENESTSAYSLTGSIDGTLTNGVAYSDYANGTWVFDGIDDYIIFDNPSDMSNAQVTVTFWYNPTTIQNSSHNGIINGQTPDGRFCLFWIGTDEVSVQYRDDSGLSRAAGGVWTRSLAPTTISTVDKWYFIQITGNESTDEWRCGVNLSPSTSDFGSQYVDPDANNWLLGKRAGTAYDNSKISNVQVYDRILSQEEITQNYQANVNLYN